MQPKSLESPHMGLNFMVQNKAMSSMLLASSPQISTYETIYLMCLFAFLFVCSIVFCHFVLGGHFPDVSSRLLSRGEIRREAEMRVDVEVDAKPWAGTMECLGAVPELAGTML